MLLRATGEALIGARAFRVVFAGISLPLAVAAVVYFINHRYSGTPLWNLRGVPGVHATVWTLSLVSFFFLYPSTFNLLEVRSDQPLLCLRCVHRVLVSPSDDAPPLDGGSMELLRSNSLVKHVLSYTDRLRWSSLQLHKSDG